MRLIPPPFRKPWIFVPLLLLAGAAIIWVNLPRRNSLELMVWATPGEKATLESMLHEFSRRHPLIRINLTTTSGAEECRRRFELRARLGRPPDLVMIRSDDLAPYVARKCLTDLSLHHPDRTPFIPAAFNAFQEGNRCWAMPVGWSTLVLYYNRSIFAAQGVPPPTPFWDWNDWLVAAQSLTEVDPKSGKTLIYGIALTPEIGMWAPLLWQNRGCLTGPSGSWALLDPRFLQSNLQAIEFYASLVREHGVARSLSTQKSEEAFLGGKVAMLPAHRRLGQKLRGVPALDWDVAPMPKGREPATTFEAYGLAITSSCQRPDEAWEAIDFLTGETSQEAMIQHGGFAPSRAALLKSRIFLDYPGPYPIRNVTFTEALPSAQALPSSTETDEIAAALSEEMLVLMSDKKQNARQTLERMQARAEGAHPSVLGQRKVTPDHVQLR